MKNIIILFLIILPNMAMANEQAEREVLVVTLFQFVIYLSFILGIIYAYKTLMTVKQRSDNPNDQSASISKIITTIIISAVLLNLNLGINLFVNTITGSSNYCFALNENVSETKNLNDCFDAESSTLTKGLRERIDSQISSRADFTNYLKLAIGAIQLLGLIYFVSSILKLKDINNGQSQISPYNVIVGLIASAALIDLPHTLELILETAKSVGVSL